MSSLTTKILKSLKLDLTEAFDRNFEKEDFFGKPWQPTKRPVKNGSILRRSHKMFNSIQSEVKGESIVYSSSMPYTAIHNEGGKAGRYGSATIPKRQFIGNSPEVDKIVKKVIDENVKRELEQFSNRFRNG